MRHVVDPIYGGCCRQIAAGGGIGNPDCSEASSASLGGERKTVTALFADIKGSTELMDGPDPEEARAIVPAGFDTADLKDAKALLDRLGSEF